MGSPENSPAELLGRIQARFWALGLFGSPLTLTLKGETCLAACDGHGFTVYRLVVQMPRASRAAGLAGRSGHMPPWWMKPASPTPAEDEFSSGQATWAIRQRLRAFWNMTANSKARHRGSLRGSNA